MHLDVGVVEEMESKCQEHGEGDSRWPSYPEGSGGDLDGIPRD